VNWSELLQKSLQRDVDIDGMQQEFIGVGVNIEPFTPQQAGTATSLSTRSQDHGLSLPYLACLALALDKEPPVMTADREWAG